jgi:hypothetical protein
MEEIAIAAFEENIKIASFALIADSGKIVYQTKNWDLSNQTNTIFDAVKGSKSFMLGGVKFSVKNAEPTSIVGINESGMGSVLIITIKGGLLISYVMPGANTTSALKFLQPYVKQINEKL